VPWFVTSFIVSWTIASVSKALLLCFLGQRLGFHNEMKRKKGQIMKNSTRKMRHESQMKIPPELMHAERFTDALVVKEPRNQIPQVINAKFQCPRKEN
jgi:hypothetical protein